MTRTTWRVLSSFRARAMASWRMADGSTGIRFGYASEADLPPGDFVAPTSMWRYSPLLPVASGPIAFPLHVGGTPLLAVPELRADVDMPALWLKDETRSPSGSCKDRATALVLERAVREGIGIVTTGLTGNAAVSTCLGAAAIGMRAVVFVPTSCEPAKLASMEACGGDVFTVDAGYSAAADLSRQLAKASGWADRNDGSEITLDANKTIAFEIWEQLGGRCPDLVVVSVGDGTTLSGLAKGFHELRRHRGITNTPRLIGVQAQACQPLVRKWQGERPGPEDLRPQATAAAGLAVIDPRAAKRTLIDVAESLGYLLSVTEPEIERAASLLSSKAGVLAEPSAAVAFAGLLAARLRDLVASQEEAVVVVTGRGWPAPDGKGSRGIRLSSATTEAFEIEMERMHRIT